jgi:hypothetical protein
VVRIVALILLICTNLAAGAKLIYLPPYSPDFNPIEQAFHSVKAWLRRHEAEAVLPEARPWLCNSTGSHVNNSGRCGRVDYQLWVLIYGRIRCARQSSNSISGHNVVQASIQWQIQTARKQIMVMRYKTLRTNQCASSSRHVPPSSHQDAHSKSCSKLETSESCLRRRQ